MHNIVKEFKKLTHGGIYLSDNSTLPLNIESQNSETGQGHYNPSNHSISLKHNPKEIKLIQDKDFSDKKLDGHEFMHSFSWGHNFQNLIQPLNATDKNDTYVAIQEPWNRKYQINSIMTYQQNHGNYLIGKEIFDRILNPDSETYKAMSNETRHAITEFCDKYSFLLSCGFTPVDICHIESQYSKNDTIESLNIINKATNGIKDFLFEYENDKLTHSGTNKTIEYENDKLTHSGTNKTINSGNHLNPSLLSNMILTLLTFIFSSKNKQSEKPQTNKELNYNFYKNDKTQKKEEIKRNKTKEFFQRKIADRIAKQELKI
jgi:hypothetical protein